MTHDIPTDREAVEQLVERMRVAYGGDLSRDCTAALRYLLSAKEAAKSENHTLLARAEAERETTAQNAARIVLKDSERIGCQKSPEPVLNWRAAYDAMGQDYKECGWGDWPSILDAALRALADDGDG